jgi:MFS family permease
LVTVAFTREEERNRALGIYSAMAGIGFVFGMVLGGGLTEWLSWRWVFFVNVPVALVALLAVPAVVPESRDESAARILDLPGALSITGGVTALIYGLTQSTTQGWTSPATVGALLGGVALIGLFATVERRSASPLIPGWVLRKGAALISNVAIGLKSTIGIAVLYVLTLYFQDVLGRTPLETGVLFVPMTAASVIAATVAGRLVTRWRVRVTALTGLALLSAGLLLMSQMSVAGGIAVVLAGMIVGEIGFMTAEVPLTVASATGLGEQQRGLAAGLLNTSLQLGNAIGLGVIATVVTARATALGGPAPGDDALVSGFRYGLLTGVCFVVLAVVVVAMGARGR